ncbi:MAG: hypothetical protein JWN86_3934 [Planctomycetota bacterium]|nr:hypothetical protein [Planctomycetota bacterium]
MLCLVLNDLMAGKPISQVREVARARDYLELNKDQKIPESEEESTTKPACYYMLCETAQELPLDEMVE